MVRQHHILGAEFRGAHPEQTRARAELDDAFASHALPPVALQKLREAKRALPHDPAAAVVQGLILLHHQLVVAPDRVPNHVSVGEVEEPLGDRGGRRGGLIVRVPAFRTRDRIRDHRLVVQRRGRWAAHGLMPARVGVHFSSPLAGKSAGSRAAPFFFSRLAQLQGLKTRARR